jgi:Ca2+-binding RTX toxin-like protein
MSIETLERRRLCSVTVTEGYPGYYEIDGDEAANDISVSVSMAGETFTLDGVTYTGVAYVTVCGKGGDDTIRLTTADGPGSIGASVSGGSGDDQVSLNFDGAVWAGSGNDTLDLADSFRGEAYGGSGNDRMTVRGECIDPEINGGGGDDLIDASANHYGVVIHGGDGNDTIYGSEFDDQIDGEAGNNTLYGNGGNDAFYCDYGGFDTVVGGAGQYDVLYTSNGSVSYTEIEYVVVTG